MKPVWSRASLLGRALRGRYTDKELQAVPGAPRCRRYGGPPCSIDPVRVRMTSRQPSRSSLSNPAAGPAWAVTRAHAPGATCIDPRRARPPQGSWSNRYQRRWGATYEVKQTSGASVMLPPGNDNSLGRPASLSDRTICSSLREPAGLLTGRARHWRAIVISIHPFPTESMIERMGGHPSTGGSPHGD
jgi:hypothetical protein